MGCYPSTGQGTSSRRKRIANPPSIELVILMLNDLNFIIDDFMNWLRNAAIFGLLVWWGYCLIDLTITISRKIKNKSAKNDPRP